jgi:hypothetical protein
VYQASTPNNSPEPPTRRGLNGPSQAKLKIHPRYNGLPILQEFGEGFDGGLYVSNRSMKSDSSNIVEASRDNPIPIRICARTVPMVSGLSLLLKAHIRSHGSRRVQTRRPRAGMISACPIRFTPRLAATGLNAPSLRATAPCHRGQLALQVKLERANRGIPCCA